jgi:transposase
MTAHLGCASPVLQVRDSRLRWGVGADGSGVVGERGYVERVLVRYRYRAYPTPAQAQMLARTFGCARVVFNDALRARQDAHAAREKVSDAEVQRRVVTLAKATPEREWLGEVASVALVQACQDARRAYRNWFDSLSGKRRGRKVGPPRFRSRKDNRQSIRLTRNGFGVTTDGVRVAKIGDVRLEWSRDLPSEPSSVTVIREADGRYFRIVCGRGGRYAAASKRQRYWDRPWPDQPGRLVHW